MNLTFQTGGTIISVPVQVGDQVKVGQVLAQLDVKDLELDYTSGADRRAPGGGALAQTKTGPNPVDVAFARAALASARPPTSRC